MLKVQQGLKGPFLPEIKLTIHVIHPGSTLLVTFPQHEPFIENELLREVSTLAYPKSTLELTVQGSVVQSAYEQLPVVHRGHRTSLENRPVVGINDGHCRLLRENILDAENL